MLFKDGTREPLHGHNYRVQVKGNALELNDDMVFDFLDIKPIVREICNSFDHKLIIPSINSQIKVEEDIKNIIIKTRNDDIFSIPKTDVLLVPIENSSVERLACHIAKLISEKIKEKFQFEFKELEVEVEESLGQSAVYLLRKDNL